MESNMKHDHKSGFGRVVAPLMEIFGLSWALSFATVLFLVVVLAFTVFWFFHSAPPKTVIITSGPLGSVFETNAMRYSNILARAGVTLKILPSQGSLENLQRLDDPAVKVDVGFVQGGINNGAETNEPDTNKLVSLGSISYQPLLVFYRGSNSLDLISDLSGKRLAIGPVGSGTRAMALALLHLNGMDPGGPTRLMDLNAEDATTALLATNVEAAFLMGDSASTAVMRHLLRAPGIQLMDLRRRTAMPAASPI